MTMTNDIDCTCDVCMGLPMPQAIRELFDRKDFQENAIKLMFNKLINDNFNEEE
jgi:hypothetical protein